MMKNSRPRSGKWPFHSDSTVGMIFRVSYDPCFVIAHCQKEHNKKGARHSSSTTMSRTVLLNRAVALHLPSHTPVSLRSVSTSKPGTKQNRDGRRTPSKNTDASSYERISSDTTPFQTKFHKKGGSKLSYVGPPILIPPGRRHAQRSLPHPPYDRSRLEGEESIVHGLWTVNVSPLLDPKDFCRKSAAFEGSYTRNGTLAARRLLEGKRRVLEDLRGDILKSSRRQRKPPRAYAIIGHGVPKQLLQAHVDMADLLLKEHRHAAAVSFKNSSGELSFETLRVRSQDGQNRALTVDHNRWWEHDTQLYLAVNNRISSVLSQILWRDNPVPANDDEDDAAPVNDDAGDDFVKSPPLPDVKLLHWNVELQRGAGNPPVPMLTPIIEWTLPEGDSLPGNVCVRLRGLPIQNSQGGRASLTQGRIPRRRKPVEVTLTFRACFQNPMQNELN